MTTLSGECVLLIDGQRFEGCTCALKQESWPTRSFAFLSAPSEVLARAQTARRMEIEFRDHPPFEVALLANNAGLALIAIADARPIRVTLSSRRWVTVVEGRDVRDVCIRAEKQLLESGSIEGQIMCEVVGADR